MANDERKALLAKGRKLLDACTADRDYACVLGYLQYNLGQGGWRAETAREFVEWLRAQSETGHEHARAILESLPQG